MTGIDPATLIAIAMALAVGAAGALVGVVIARFAIRWDR